MRRSKDANLTISFSTDVFSRDSFHAFCDVIRTSSHRVCELTVKEIERERILEDAFKDVPHSSMSRLQSLAMTLSISISSYHRKNFDTLRFIEKYIGDTSDLRRVDLYCTAAWDSRILNDLTHLTIRNEFMLPVEQLASSTQFFDAIRRMPRLQELHLDSVVLTTAGDDIVKLLLLRTLMLRGNALEAANVLRHLRILPSCSVDIECRASKSSAGLISSLRNLFFAPPSSDTLVPSMGFLQLGLKRGTIEFWASLAPQVAPLTNPPPNHSPFLAITLCFAVTLTHIEIIQRIIIGAFNALSCRNLFTFSLVSNVPPGVFDDCKFLDALGQQPILEDIHVETGFISQFLDYMALRTDASNTPFPALRVVHFFGMDYQWVRRQPFPVQDLQRFVRQRKELGIGLQRLTIERCCLLKAVDIELLGNSVDEVSCGVDDSAYEVT